MALSDKWTLNQLTTLCMNELADPTNRWFTQAEISTYLDEAQMRCQEWFEFVWSTATATVSAIGTITNSVGLVIPAGTASILLSTFIPDAMRCDAFYWISSTQTGTDTHGVRLVPRTKQDLNVLVRDWRNVIPMDPPLVVYQDDITDIVLWPPPANMGTLIAEYPQKLCFGGTGTNTMQIPAWTKYGLKYYVAYRCFFRTGPRQDLQRAMSYRAMWDRYITYWRWKWDSYFPEKYTQLKPKQPSDQYNIAILNPPYITIIPP